MYEMGEVSFHLIGTNQELSCYSLVFFPFSPLYVGCQIIRGLLVLEKKNDVLGNKK